MNQCMNWKHGLVGLTVEFAKLIFISTRPGFIIFNKPSNLLSPIYFLILYRAHTKDESNVIHQLREKESEMDGIMEEKERLLEDMMKEREREKHQLEEVKGGGAIVM